MKKFYVTIKKKFLRSIFFYSTYKNFYSYNFFRVINFFMSDKLVRAHKNFYRG